MFKKHVRLYWNNYQINNLPNKRVYKEIHRVIN